MKEQHQVSYATKHKIETVRDWFFFVLGISLLGIGFWDMAFPSQALSNAVIVIGSVGPWNTVALIVSGLIITLVAIALLMRLKRSTSV